MLGAKYSRFYPDNPRESGRFANRADKLRGMATERAKSLNAPKYSCCRLTLAMGRLVPEVFAVKSPITVIAGVVIRTFIASGYKYIEISSH
jgi:hypothetical protein